MSFKIVGVFQTQMLFEEPTFVLCFFLLEQVDGRTDNEVKDDVHQKYPSK